MPEARRTKSGEEAFLRARSQQLRKDSNTVVRGKGDGFINGASNPASNFHWAWVDRVISALKGPK